MSALAVAVGLAALPAPAAPQPAPTGNAALDRVLSELEPEIARAMSEGRIPSLTIALTSGEDVLWAHGYGESNLRTRTPATPETVYIIASTLKTMMGTVVLQLVEEGRIGLDDAVSPHLGDLRIRGEDPSRPITVRHLLTHTSGLRGGFSGVPVWADTVPMPMDDFLRERLVVEGPPGEEVRYSNPGFTVLGRLIEELTGGDLKDEVEARIWEPLGMTSTAFAPTPVMEEVLAVPYRPDPGTGAQVPTNRVRFAEWPAGGAWGTVVDQARWMAASLALTHPPEEAGEGEGAAAAGGARGEGAGGAAAGGAAGEGEGVAGTVASRPEGRLLSPESARLMQSLNSPDFTGSMAGGGGGSGAGYGLAWWTTTLEGERYIAHSGSVGGYTAFIHGNRDRQLGVAILTNGQRAHAHLVRLSKLATALMAREGLDEGR
ncbi:MAG: class A beta-lactamase-related serine hydrolase [Gemmatimonadales bacterium]|nr:MAG: class A beta-lactamase-related serine hydrolase [Gemmatimonadales bacterium]